ncbi:ABC transporter ATP-binding protein [Mycoplasma crocodyli]|uniref:ABC transporter, ATP-binding protein n=1 Tax=Mycoplasma crocodyli (strain ATCC 51981 / MP145) TaxID=512564 RepID=D5E533_MYCCM|nr:ABC transporter ATP-binding protein [Mycoplasma crocodyli]ADE19723.1 ABC transporter, ATP-binding protein [Mycoplasma crocodyli MP145]
MNNTLNNNFIVSVKNVNKSFGKNHVLKDLSINLKEGQLFSFLGLNGAGKSTLVNIIAGLLKKDSGEIDIDGLKVGKDTEAIKQKIGILFQYPVMDPLLSVADNLMIRASLYHLKKDDLKKAFNKIVADFQLEKLLKRPYGKLSGGQQRRVNIARSLIHTPKILFLDEPTTGLDPVSRKLVWDVIEQTIREKHLTVFLTTHYMEEANNSDYVVIIDEGKIVSEGTPSELKVKYARASLIVYTQGKNEKLEKLFEKENIEYKVNVDKYIAIFKSIEPLHKFLVKHDDIIKEYEVLKGTMDDVFMNATGKKASDL